MIVVLRWRNLRAAVVAFLLGVHCIYITSLPLPFMEGSRLRLAVLQWILFPKVQGYRQPVPLLPYHLFIAWRTLKKIQYHDVMI